MNKKKQLAKNTIIIFLGRVCTQLISYFLLPLYTSYLATEEYLWNSGMFVWKVSSILEKS